MLPVSRTRLLAGAAALVVALPVLSACTAQQQANAPAVASSAAEKAASGVSAAQEAGASAVTQAQEAAKDAAAAATASVAGDQVLNAIDAVAAKYPEGIIVSADREDNDAHTEVDVVMGNTVMNVYVYKDGNVSDAFPEDDDDDVFEKVGRASAATVGIKDAASQALSQTTNTIIDSISLDDDGRLHWDVDLDDVNTRQDLPDLMIPAN
ncbi:MAG: hypothetical protein Q4A31_06190 [Corynebacterium sp.]|uniref:hypothetical protein n=1 Tax=Corynebacterium sp. TaxID=1720 RepID=UPI0026DAF419|nr:hypothetical protein [Corynebacterium sp.]MDO4761487.1 hypothetical protein [Corynebacterium sp.]